MYQAEILNIETLSQNELDVDEMSDEELEAISGLDVDADLAIERLQFKLKAWKHRIAVESCKLFSDEALWTYFEHDSAEIKNQWETHTADWIKKFLVQNTKDKRIESQYKKYVQRFRKLAKAMKQRKCQEDYAATVQKHLHLLDALSTVSASDLVEVGKDKEGDSALFNLLRNRPDLLAAC